MLRLRQSADLGRTWRPLTAPLLQVGQVIQLVREDARDAWLWGGTPALLATHDGGATWHPLPDPCGSPAHLLGGNGLAALPPHKLWVLCGGEPGAGNQGKALFSSRDGGHHWRELACVPGWVKLCPAPGVGRLPSGGYVGQLFMLTPHRGVITLYRSNLLATDDGGRTWTEPMRALGAVIGAGNPDPATFVDAQHG